MRIARLGPPTLPEKHPEVSYNVTMIPSVSAYKAADPWARRCLGSHFSRAPVPPWYAGSLTAALKAHYPDLRVEILFEGQRPPRGDEARLPGIARRKTVWTREVLLCHGNIPLIYAHSILPAAGKRHAWNWLRSLGTRPLGEALFSYPGMRRSPLRFRRLPRHHPLMRSQLSSYALRLPLIARRSAFLLQRTTLLVTEIFLAFPQNKPTPA